MKKGIKGFITIFLSLIMLLGITACTGKETIDIDTTKSQLYVYSYNGGVGNEWLRGTGGIIERFEKAFENYEFEPGKKGVQIVPNCVKDGVDLSNMEYTQDEVFFSEWVQIPSFISSGKFLEIDDVVSTPLNEFLEGRTTDTDTIEDKLYPEQQDFFAMRDNKYYALPHYSHFGTLTYNKALFDAKGFYFAKNPTGSSIVAKFISATNTVKSCGPDGVLGNEDDGLPATWDEMWDLFNYMKQKQVTPISWTGGGADGYTKNLLTATFLNLAGKQDAYYNWKPFSGEDTINIVTGWDKNNNPIIGTTTVAATNDTILNSQLEKYYAICVYDKIIDNQNWQTEVAKGVEDNMAAQADFILSVNENHPVGVFVEGSYWYNEATDGQYFIGAEVEYPDFWDKNEFCVMPLPRVYNGTAAANVEGKQVHKAVVTDQSDSVACISSKIKDDPYKIKLAKMFLAYCYTQESLEQFEIKSSCPRYLKYDVDTTKLQSDYARNLHDYVANADILLPYSSDSRYTNNKSLYSLHNESTFWNNGSGQPFNSMNGSPSTALAFFKKFMNK